MVTKCGLLLVAAASKVRIIHAEMLDEAEATTTRNRIEESDGLLERRRKYEGLRKLKEKPSKAIQSHPKPSILEI